MRFLRRRTIVSLVPILAAAGSLLVAAPAQATVHYGIKCGNWATLDHTLSNGTKAGFSARACIQRTRSADRGKAWVRAFVNIKNIHGPVKTLYGSAAIAKYTSTGLRIVHAYDNVAYATSPTGVGKAWGTKAYKVDASRKFWGLGRVTWDFKNDGASSHTDALNASGGY